EGARNRLEERRAAEEKARERVSGAEERLSMLRVRHSELEAAIEQAGISGIRDRLAQMESELESAREAERKAIEAAGRARKESDERAADAEEAAARLESCVRPGEREPRRADAAGRPPVSRRPGRVRLPHPCEGIRSFRRMSPGSSRRRRTPVPAPFS